MVAKKNELLENSHDFFNVAIGIGLFVITSISLILAGYSKDFLSIGYIFFHFYVLLLYFIYKRRNEKLKDKYSWKPHKAKVWSTKVQKHSCSQRWGYYPKIKYHYVIDGKRYVSDNFFPIKCEGFYTKEKAEQLLEKLVKNFEVIVYVNPNNPSESVVIRGENGEFEFPLIYLVLFYLIPYNALFYYLFFT